MNDRFLAVVIAGFLLFAPVVTFAAEPTLSQQIKQLESMDMRTLSKDAVFARTQPLMAKALKDPSVPPADLYIIRRLEATAWFFAGDANKALALFDEMLVDLSKSPLKNSATDMEMRANRAALLGQMGRSAESLAALQGIRTWFAQNKGKNNEEYISITAEVGSALFSTGDPVGAEKAAAEAVSLARENHLPDKELVRLWINWGALLHNAGRPADGIRELQNVARYSEEKLGQDHPFTIAALRNLATDLNNAGRFSEAQIILQRNLDINRRVEGATSPNLTYTLNSLGAAALGSQGALAAIPFYEQAVQHVSQFPDKSTPHLYGEVALNLAQAYESAGRAADALALRQTVLQRIESTLGKEHATYARASGDLGASLMYRGDVAQAVPYLRAANVLNERLLKPRSKIRVQNQVMLGSALYRQGDPAGYGIAQAAEQIARDAVLEDLTTPTQTLRNAAQYSIAFTDFAELALRAGHPDDAIQSLQLAQLGELDSAGAAYMARTLAENSTLAPVVRKLQDNNAALAKLRAERSTQVAANNQQQVAELDTRTAALEADISALNTSINASFPAYQQMIRPQPVSLKQLQAHLKPGNAVLFVQSGRNGVISMLVDPLHSNYAVTPVGRGEVGTWVKRVRGSINNALESDNFDPAFDVGAAYQLYRAVVPAALEPKVRTAKTLYIQSSGALSLVPFGALVTSKPAVDLLRGNALRQTPWLIRRQAVITPATLALLGNARAPHSQVAFAGIGAPNLQGKTTYAVAMRGLNKTGGSESAIASLPSLPGAQQELSRLSQAFGSANSLLLTGPNATRNKIMGSDLSRYNVIAFATHGLVSGELRGVTEPGLVMTPVAGDPASGLLTASDVASLRLNADWVILSACNTAAGESPGAPMYSGLARAFIFAGTRGLLLSQWPVRDDLAARLTLQTVQASQQGKSRAQALRQSQLNLISDKSIKGGANPAAWAPFVLIGQ